MIPSAKGLLFGTAGVPKSAPGTSTISGIQEITRLGLDCLEVEFVRGTKLGSDTAKKIHETAVQNNIRLSAHAPYYINLNSPDEGKKLSSQERILSSARRAQMCGAKSLVFHPGYYGEKNREKSFDCIKKAIKEVVSMLKSEGNTVTLRPETMGKKSQFGSLEETLFLCREIDGLMPCIDFSHIHARDGKANTYLEFHRIFTKIQKKLGLEALKNMHIHISGSMYNDKGEMKHLNLQESDFRFDEWIQAVKDFEIEGLVISESPQQEADALMLKKLYKG
jgi:deoxyribonuclease-4